MSVIFSFDLAGNADPISYRDFIKEGTPTGGADASAKASTPSPATAASSGGCHSSAESCVEAAMQHFFDVKVILIVVVPAYSYCSYAMFISFCTLSLKQICRRRGCPY